MSENFSELLEQSLASKKLRDGELVKAIVIQISSDTVIVNAGLKSEGVIRQEEFMNSKGELEVEVGNEVDVIIEAIDDGTGETSLSREKAKRHESWLVLEEAHEANKMVQGSIVRRVKGGFAVNLLNNVAAFLPGSQIDIRPISDISELEGSALEFKIIKMDRKRNNIVVSRRAVIEAESSVEREALLKSLHEGQELKGIVKNLTDYGAFIDLGGIDGLLHITDISWKRVKHPSEIINVGDDIMVKVLKFDRERGRVSLGMKQLGDDPWKDIAKRYPPSSRLFGKVTNITDYGCFVEIEQGVEGLVHMSEMDWTNKNIHPNKVVQLGDEVEVMVLEIDEGRRRISLGMKQCADNPWKTFGDGHKKGDQITGNIKSITDFGIFVGLDGEIDGLIHLSDISWNEVGEEAVKEYKKGQELTTVILGIDPERERISLGIKQLGEDPFTDYVANNKKGSVVSGKVTAVDSKSVTVELAEDISGVLRANELSAEKVEDARKVVTVGDTIEAKIINVDKKNRSLSLSVKAKDVEQEEEALKRYTKEGGTTTMTTTLGDLLKEKMVGDYPESGDESAEKADTDVADESEAKD